MINSDFFRNWIFLCLYPVFTSIVGKSSNISKVNLILTSGEHALVLVFPTGACTSYVAQVVFRIFFGIVEFILVPTIDGIITRWPTSEQLILS